MMSVKYSMNLYLMLRTWKML